MEGFKQRLSSRRIVLLGAVRPSLQISVAIDGLEKLVLVQRAKKVAFFACLSSAWLCDEGSYGQSGERIPSWFISFIAVERSIAEMFAKCNGNYDQMQHSGAEKLQLPSPCDGE